MRILTTVAEYDGGTDLELAPTQLDASYSATRSRRVVQEWCDFFAAGPTGIQRIAFRSRVPARLFAALAGQTQLETLFVKWGDYADLTALAGMTGLRELHLGGAVRVADVSPLASLPSLQRLVLAGLRDAHDLTPLAASTSVEELGLEGDAFSPRLAHVDSIGFLRRMPQLTVVELIALIVDDKDYSPLLDLPRLRSTAVMRTRGMHPSYDDLRAVLPFRR